MSYCVLVEQLAKQLALIYDKKEEAQVAFEILASAIANADRSVLLSDDLGNYCINLGTDKTPIVQNVRFYDEQFVIAANVRREEEQQELRAKARGMPKVGFGASH